MMKTDIIVNKTASNVCRDLNDSKNSKKFLKIVENKNDTVNVDVVHA